MSTFNSVLDRVFRFFETRINPFPVQEPTVPPRDLWSFFRYYLRGSEKQLLLMACLAMAYAVIEVVLYGALGRLVDWMIASDRDNFMTTYAVELIILSAVLLVVMPCIIALDSLNTHQGVLGNLPMRIRWLGHRYLLKQSMGFYAEDFAGRVATKLMQTALSIRDCAIKLCDVMLYIFVYFISSFVLLASVDWRLGLPVFMWAFVYIGLMYYFLPRMKAVATEQAEARSMMTGRVVDAYSNIMTVKLFSHADRETEYAKEAMDPFLASVYKQMRLATAMQFCVQSSVFVLLFCVCATSVVLWTYDVVSTSMIAVAMMLTMRLNGLSEWVMWEANMFFEHLGTVTDGKETIAHPLALTDMPDAEQLYVHQGRIELKDVSFHYGKGSGVIEGFNLHIQPGEKIGIVGRSGAGKSTLVNLLLRFYDVESGQILIDEQPIQTMTQDSLRSQIGVVTQDTALLHRTIRENILYGRTDANEEAVQIAIEKAQVTEFLDDLIDQYGNRGLDALVGERGVKLSGGQRQRIAIARVLLKDAPILMLDEATSALDSEVEQAIQESLSVLMEGKTVIAIAHRLSTIAALDRLIIIDKGAIVEQGTHEELLALEGIYAQLWAHQSGGFIANEDENRHAQDTA